MMITYGTLRTEHQEEGRNQKIQPEGAALEIRIAIATRGVGLTSPCCLNQYMWNPVEILNFSTS